MFIVLFFPGIIELPNVGTGKYKYFCLLYYGVSLELIRSFRRSRYYSVILMLADVESWKLKALNITTK